MKSKIPTKPTPDESSSVSEFSEQQIRYQRRVFAFILTLVPRWSDAEEILQNTNVILCEKREQFKPGTDFVRWANRIAYIQVQKYFESHKKSKVFFSDTFMKDAADKTISRSDSLNAQREALKLCIKKLPEKDRSLIAHRYLKEATVQTIGKVTGRSHDAVYKALQRARNSLLACVRRTLSAEEQR